MTSQRAKMVFFRYVCLFCFCYAVVESQPYCEDGWRQFPDGFGNALCVLVVKENATWENARRTCENKLASLGNLDRFDLTYFNISRERMYSIAQELFDNGVMDFWSGMHIKQGRLMWDDIGPRLVSRPRFVFNEYPWDWEKFQPDSNTGNCGKSSVKVMDGFPERDVIVTLNDCTESLPYICQKSANVLFMEPVDICPPGFLGNPFLPHCYKLSEDLVTYDVAQRKCKLYNNGILVQANTNFDRQIVETVTLTAKGFEERPENMMVWVQDSRTNSCTVFQLNTLGPNEQEKFFTNTQCNTSTLYMCAVPVVVPDEASVRATSLLFNQEDLLGYPAFLPLPVTFSLNRKRYRNEAVFIRTPVDILNSTHQFMKWDYTLGYLNWNIQQNERLNESYHVNVTIPEHQNPSKRRDIEQDDFDVINKRQRRQYKRKRRQSGTTTPFYNEGGFPTEGFYNEGGFPTEVPRFFVDYDYVRRSTGYYQFELTRYLPPRYVTSVERFVRYSETDLYIYVVYATLQKDVLNFRAFEPILSIEDSNLFNLLKDNSYMGNLEEYMNSVLYEEPYALAGSTEYYRGQIEFIDISKNVTKLRFFVCPRNARQKAEDYESSVLSSIANHLNDTMPRNIFVQSSLRVFSTVNCGYLKTVVDGKQVTFFPVRVGRRGYSSERCFPGRTALATATCIGGYDDGVRWSNIMLNETCGAVPILNQSESTMSLKNISQTKITQDNYLDVINDTVTLTDPKVNLTEADVIYTADIISDYLAFRPSNNEQILDDVCDIVNNVLYTKRDYLDSAQTILNAANRIILSTDKLTNGIVLSNNEPVKIVKEFLAAVILEQPGIGDLTIGIKLDETDNTTFKQGNINTVGAPTDIPLTGTDTAIYLTRKLAEGAWTRLAFQLYSKTDLFGVVNSRFKVNSKVVAARMTKGGKNIEELGDEIVTAVFSTLEYDENMICAYWNYSASEDAGGWESKGCTMDTIVDGRVVCKCNHLTNFAVLIDLEANTISDTDKLVLGIITKVGLIISIVCLAITVVTFLVFKHLRKGRGQQVLVNLSVAMLCSAILFLVGIDRTETRTGCIIVAALLHYFILVTFMWMLVEGVLQYLRFVKVLGTYIPNFMKKSMIPAWGLPLIPLIVILALDYNMYYGGNGYCWLTWEPFLYGFLIPIAAVILINLIVFTMVMCNLLCLRKNKGMASNQSERKMAFLHLRAGLSILVILGLTWLFGFLTVDTTRIIFHYLFAIFNAFQGCFIFLLFTFRETQVRKAWKKLCCGAAKYKNPSSNTDSRGKKNGSTETRSTGYSNKSSSTIPDSHSDRRPSDQEGLTFNNPHYNH